MDITKLVDSLSTLGVGGAIAGFIFYFYRKDVQQYTELWKNMSTVLIQVVQENTKAVTANIEVVKSLHKRMDNERPLGRQHPRND